MKKFIARKAFDVQSIIASSFALLILGIPPLTLSIVESNFGFFVIFLSILLLYIGVIVFIFLTTKKVVFTKESIQISTRKSTKELNWYEVQVEYLGVGYIIFLQCFTIQLTYFDSKTEKPVTLTIPSSRKTFIQIMCLRSNHSS